MDRAEQLRDELAFTDRMIAECQLHITRLKKIISEMMRDAQDTDLARDVLASYAAALTRHEAQRKLVASMMTKIDAADAAPAKATAAPTRAHIPRQPPSQGAGRTRTGRRAVRR